MLRKRLSSVDGILGALVWWLMSGLAFLMLAGWLNDPIFLSFINGLVPILLILGLTISLVLLIRCNRHNLIRPISMFLISCCLYHGFGTLLYTFGSGEEIAATMSFYQFEALHLTKVLILNQSCILAVIIGYLGITWWSKGMIDMPRNPARADRKYLPFMSLLALWGICVKFFVMLPWDLRLTDTPPAGLLVGTHSLSYGSLFYLWYLSAQDQARKQGARFFLVLEISYGLISLSKLALIVPILIAILGSQTARPIRKRTWGFLVSGGVAVLLLLQPINTYLRYRREGLAPTGISDMAGALAILTDPDAVKELADMRKTGLHSDSFWTRLSYVNVEAFVIAKRAEGLSGHSYRYFKHLFIPRWFWPDKPIVNPGLDFNKEWLGSDNAAIGVTLFGEAYFNLGWTGVPLIGVGLALLLWLLEWPMRWVIGQGRFEQSMLIFMGIFVGLRVDDSAIMLVSTVIAGGGMSWLLLSAWRFWSQQVLKGALS